MLRYDLARSCYDSIMKSKHVALRHDLFVKAADYASLHVQWRLAAREQRIALDPRIRQAHYAFVQACDTLSRNMGKVREDNTWRVELGADLKTLGEFACYIHLFIGMESK